MSYFPSALHADWREEIAQHPLRREIIATVLANRIVNLSGITAVYRLTEESGLDAESAALALLSAMEISGLDTLKSQLSADSVTWPARIAVSLEARRYVDRIARWLLAHRANAEQLVSDLDRLREVAHAVRRLIATHLKGGELQRWQQSATSFESLGMPRDLAATFAGLLDEYAALDLADRPASEAVPTEIWSQVYFEISEIVGGDAILNAISALPRQDRWQTMARAAMRADMYAVLATLASAVLEMSEADRVGQWQATHAVGIGRVRAVVTEISSAPVSDLAAISVALRMLRELVAQSS
jgi:glutamate dehydrogenase